jgi:aspartate carbamoyltransferase regulatory subunit
MTILAKHGHFANKNGTGKTINREKKYKIHGKQIIQCSSDGKSALECKSARQRFSALNHSRKGGNRMLVSKRRIFCKYCKPTLFGWAIRS